MKRHLLAGVSLLALAVAASSSEAAPLIFDYTGTVVSFTVPTNGGYQILAYGAQGGKGGSSGVGGLGAEIGGDFILTANEVLKIVVGGAGGSGSYSGGGGGSSFVIGPGNQPLIIAGGGGGAGGPIPGYGNSGYAGQTSTAGSDGGGTLIHKGKGGSGGSGGSG